MKPVTFDWKKFRNIQKLHRLLYAVGLGPVIGRIILLLTTTGRKSGQKRVTPLQYEEIDGKYYLGSARGTRSDWYRNIEADGRVEVRVKNRRFYGMAEPVTDPVHIADFLEVRLRRHPRMIGLLMEKTHGLPRHPSRRQLEELAATEAMVVIHPLEEFESNTLSGYDTVAEEYARLMFREFDHKPFDRQMMDRLITMVGNLGPICDMGCGPGEVARYLKDHGADALGMDLSPEMIKVARRLSPDISFRQGIMLALNVPDASWGGVAAFYSVIHIPRPRVVEALLEIRRVLKPGGVLLVTFHIGNEVVHVNDWHEHQVSLDFTHFQPEEMREYLAAAGFGEIEINVREPYPEVEYQSRRAYIFARRPHDPD